MESRIGLSSLRAFSKAASSPRKPVHRVVRVLQQVGDFSPARAFVCLGVGVVSVWLMR